MRDPTYIFRDKTTLDQRNPSRSFCTHPGCSAWAVRGAKHCRDHLTQEERDLV